MLAGTVERSGRLYGEEEAEWGKAAQAAGQWRPEEIGRQAAPVKTEEWGKDRRGGGQEEAEQVTEPAKSGIFDYDELLKDELAAEDARKDSLEARGVAVVTTSGALVTLLFALSALSTEEQATYELSDFASVVLAIALVLFVGAAIVALLINRPMDYIGAKVDDIEKLLNAESPSGSEQARKDVAFARLTELRSARQINGRKADLLLRAMGLEVAAVVAVGVAVVSILL